MIKNKYLPLVLLLCLIANLGFSQNCFEEGMKQFDADNFSNSIEWFTKAILNKQKIARSLMMRGAAKIYLVKLQDAVTDLESSKKLDPTNSRLYYYYAKYYYLSDSLDLAIANYSKCIAIDPRAADAYMERADARGFKHDLQGALIDANKGISIDSTKAYYYTDRGCIRTELKQYEEAFKDFNKSLKIKPNQRAYANRGVAWSLTDQHQKAIEDFTRSLEFDPNAGELYYYRGKSYKALGKKEEAYADLKKSSELGFTQSDAELKALDYTRNYYEEANKEYDLANYSKSVELFTQAILNDQEIAKSLMMRGAAKLYLYQFEDAGTDLESSKQIDSTDPQLYFYFGKYYRVTSQNDLAISSYSRVIASTPRDAVSYSERGMAKEAKNDLEGAISDLNISISIDSTNELCYTERGQVRILQKQYENAIKDLNTSIKIKPTLKAYAKRGWAWSLMNQHQKAIEDYTKSLTINPDDVEVHYYRAISYKALEKKTEACADLKKSSELGYTQADAVLKELKCDQ
ncbi:MAG: tetratricopeptide repeat protein [Niastella sp.]|jgi:tetratricopeptide (TPR) repeat protein|uniref:tetratricopeptide repeat protein n=1 Tax=Niastella sp. TaxID=1869183 RepID=UPI00389B257E